MRQRLIGLLPGIRLVRDYQVAWLPADLAAGVTLGAVMVPVGLAFGQLAGLPLAGLYAGILPLLAYAAFGSSRQLIVGPDASMASLVAVTIAPLAAGDAVRFQVFIGVFAILIGLVCILGAVLRLGFMADFLAKPVVVGFMHGLTVVIAIGQLPKVLGIPVAADSTLAQLAELATGLERINWVTFSIGAFCVAVILACHKWAPRVPGQIVALLVSLLAVSLMDLERFGVSVVGDIPKGLPGFHLPVLSLEDVRLLLPVACAGALVAFSDTVVTARAFASRNRYTIDANQEMPIRRWWR